MKQEDIEEEEGRKFRRPTPKMIYSRLLTDPAQHVRGYLDIVMDLSSEKPSSPANNFQTLKPKLFQLKSVKNIPLISLEDEPTCTDRSELPQPKFGRLGAGEPSPRGSRRRYINASVSRIPGTPTNKTEEKPEYDRSIILPKLNILSHKKIIRDMERQKNPQRSIAISSFKNRLYEQTSQNLYVPINMMPHSSKHSHSKDKKLQFGNKSVSTSVKSALGSAAVELITKRRLKPKLKTEQISQTTNSETVDPAQEQVSLTSAVSSRAPLATEMQRTCTVFQKVSRQFCLELCRKSKLHRYAFREAIIDKRVYRNRYTYILIEGKVQLESRKYGIKKLLEEGATFQEEAILESIRDSKQDNKYDLAWSMASETVCLRFGKKEWEEVCSKESNMRQEDSLKVKNELKRNYFKKVYEMLQKVEQKNIKK